SQSRRLTEGRAVPYPTPSAVSCALSLHDALPISLADDHRRGVGGRAQGEVAGVAHRLLVGEWVAVVAVELAARLRLPEVALGARSEEHTSELQSRENLVCRLLLEKKNRCRSARAP